MVRAGSRKVLSQVAEEASHLRREGVRHRSVPACGNHVVHRPVPMHNLLWRRVPVPLQGPAPQPSSEGAGNPPANRGMVEVVPLRIVALLVLEPEAADVLGQAHGPAALPRVGRPDPDHTAVLGQEASGGEREVLVLPGNRPAGQQVPCLPSLLWQSLPDCFCQLVAGYDVPLLASVEQEPRLVSNSNTHTHIHSTNTLPELCVCVARLCAPCKRHTSPAKHQTRSTKTQKRSNNTPQPHQNTKHLNPRLLNISKTSTRCQRPAFLCVLHLGASDCLRHGEDTCPELCWPLAQSISAVPKQGPIACRLPAPSPAARPPGLPLATGLVVGKARMEPPMLRDGATCSTV